MQPSTLPELTDALRTASARASVDLIRAAMPLAFDGKAPGKTALRDDQRALLAALVENQAFWSMGTAVLELLIRGFPTSRAAVAVYAGVKLPFDPVAEVAQAEAHLADDAADWALSHVQQALAAEPHFAPALALLPVAWLGLDAREEALAAIADAVQVQPSLKATFRADARLTKLHSDDAFEVATR